MVKFSKLIKKLKKKKLKISFAESCTGGLLAQSITSISGASKVFNLSVVTYSNKSKSSILNVPKKIINKFGAVSEECCLSMVKNLAKISKSQINVSITGIAGPKGGSKFKPVGLVFIGIKYKGKSNIYKYLFTNKTRRSIQNASAKAVVNNLLNLLNNFSALLWNASAILSRPYLNDLFIKIFKILFFNSKSRSKVTSVKFSF